MITQSTSRLSKALDGLAILSGQNAVRTDRMLAEQALQSAGSDIAASGSDDGMFIDSPITNHYHAAPAQPAKPEMSTMAKLGIAAALVTSGIGAGAAIPLAISALTKDAPAVVAPVAPVNTDTTTERDYSIGEVLIEGPQ